MSQGIFLQILILEHSASYNKTINMNIGLLLCRLSFGKGP